MGRAGYEPFGSDDAYDWFAAVAEKTKRTKNAPGRVDADGHFRRKKP